MKQKYLVAPGTYTQKNLKQTPASKKLGQQPARLNDGEVMDTVQETHHDLAD